LKESKESGLWLSLLDITSGKQDLLDERSLLQDESRQFVRIFSSMLKKAKSNLGN
jgi:hypothetical protein